MEYATRCNEICDDNFYRYVGYQENNDCLKKLFAPQTIKTMSQKITQLLMGVDPQNRPIIIPNNTICGIISQVYYSFRPATGDIFSRYTIPTGTGNTSYVQDIINQSIEIITNNVRTTLEMEQNNEKLTVWTTVYGDFNEHGLRQHAPIKVRNKRPDPMQFNMNY